ncbi:TetR family transcriptional regulator [Nonomuraea sp. NPDC005650]|uniref:TetR/AcrR family transcriptional regulator n=1 Tax=Nonomuraea sp. NPDC005650 TaxID=3157045 RepID=UPI0033A45A03
MAARRAPRPEERGKAAELTRERILRAAVSEFGEKGYSGARTAGIAARAGVNQQLISYYFGGKQGLLEELRRRRQADEAAPDGSAGSFSESVGAQLARTLDDPEWARLVVWQALGDCPFADAEDGQRYAEAQRARMAESLERMRGRQEAGEVTERADPAFALLVAYAVVFAPITMPQFVRDIFGDDPLSPEVRRRLHSGLVRLLGEAED